MFFFDWLLNLPFSDMCAKAKIVGSSYEHSYMIQLVYNSKCGFLDATKVNSNQEHRCRALEHSSKMPYSL